jgi:aspartate/tyrosine/aromatic aminotransferase
LFYQAEQLLLDRKVDKEYAGIMGYDFFRKEAYKLAFGEDQNFKENCVRDKEQ